MKHGLLLLSVWLVGCATAAPPPAPETVVSTSDATAIFSDGWRGSLWLSSDFDGTQTRRMTGNTLVVDMEQRAKTGGLDAGVGLEADPRPAVATLHADTRACFDFDMDVSGEGRWWAGPKISVNWQDDGDYHGMSGWYENYVVEAASTSFDDILDGITGYGQGVFLGTTEQDGATYHHYRAKHSDWTQFWSVREGWRDSGTTSIRPILDMWVEGGLPEDLPVDGIKLNVETYGPVAGEIAITGIVDSDMTRAPVRSCEAI